MAPKKKIIVDPGMLAENPVLAEAGVAVGAEGEDIGPAVVVEWKGNHRVFSKEVHGKDYKDLAKQFAEKFGGTIK